MNRNAIIEHIKLHVKKSGSLNKVAEKCGVNISALSTILNNKYGANEQKMLGRIAAALNYKESDWRIVRSITNYKRIAQTCEDAKQESLWFAISNKAGSGKTGTLEDIYNSDYTGSIYHIQCQEWTGRQFLQELIKKTAGESEFKGRYKTIAELVQIVCDFFNENQAERPLLLIDEADKLRPAGMRALIPLYNKCEDRLGCVLSGTENLEKEIKAGVRLAKKGFDELESRLGRSYIHLLGATQKEVYEICAANGLVDPQKQEQVWHEVDKVKKPATVRTPTGSKEMMIEFCEDFRRLKRIIKREKLRRQAA